MASSSFALDGTGDVRQAPRVQRHQRVARGSIKQTRATTLTSFYIRVIDTFPKLQLDTSP